MAASKKRPARKAGSARKKSPAKRAATSTKRRASSKRAAARPAKKKSTSTKRPSRKKATATRPSAKKRPAKKAAAKKKAASKKKATSKAPAKKPAAAKAKAKSAGAPTSRAAPKRPPARPRRSTAQPEPAPGKSLIHGIAPYQPKAGEAYMSDPQLEHFRQILLAWKRELMEEVDRTVHHMQDEASNFPDPNDRATQESEFGLELRTRDRERKLLKKIDSALERIEDGSYGFCEETGEEIGLRRLEARPVATLSVEAQERRELSERQYGERDDRYR